MAVLLLFGPAREAAGTARADVDGVTVAEIQAAACARFGPAFTAIAETAAIWLNGEPASSDQPVGPLDELAVVPPVSGG